MPKELTQDIRNKQIEEMAADLASMDEMPFPTYKVEAEYLYDKGYRKQEWKV